MKHLLHRFWRLIPRDFRRAALFKVTGLLAPRPSARAPRRFDAVTIAGVVSARSGLAQSALGLARRFESFGSAVTIFDLAPAFLSGRGEPRPAALPSAALPSSEVSPSGSEALIIVINGPFLPLAMTHIGRRRLKDRYLVTHWSWELESLPADWRHGFGRTHEIWVSSEFMARAIRAQATCPVYVVPPTPADVLLAAMPLRRERTGPFTVLTMFDMGSSFARKNPLAAIAAFRAAFGGDQGVRLIVKVNQPEAFAPGARAVRDAIDGADNIVLLTDSMDRSAVLDLIASCDTLISTHRSEGFGLPMFEAMLLERAVVATGWSANMEFMSSENSILLPYRLIPAIDPQDTYTLAGATWADADVAAASAALIALRNDPALCRRLGEKARLDALAFIDRHDATLRALISNDRGSA
jgi:glycosyltransferase involved in cell wall biosynthesis